MCGFILTYQLRFLVIYTFVFWVLEFMINLFRSRPVVMLNSCSFVFPSIVEFYIILCYYMFIHTMIFFCVNMVILLALFMYWHFIIVTVVVICNVPRVFFLWSSSYLIFVLELHIYIFNMFLFFPMMEFSYNDIVFGYIITLSFILCFWFVY